MPVHRPGPRGTARRLPLHCSTMNGREPQRMFAHPAIISKHEPLLHTRGRSAGREEKQRKKS